MWEMVFGWTDTAEIQFTNIVLKIHVWRRLNVSSIHLRCPIKCQWCTASPDFRPLPCCCTTAFWRLHTLHVSGDEDRSTNSQVCESKLAEDCLICCNGQCTFCLWELLYAKWAFWWPENRIWDSGTDWCLAIWDNDCVFLGRVFMQAIRSGRQCLPPSLHKRNFFSLPNVVPDIFDSRKIYSERKLLKYIMEWTTFSKFFHAVHYLLILWLQLFPSSSIRRGFKCNGLPPIYTILYSFQSIFVQICDFCHCTRPCGYGGRTRSWI